MFISSQAISSSVPVHVVILCIFISSLGISSSASVTCSDIYPGVYDFQISFQPNEEKERSPTFSEKLRKLFVDRETPCPILFKTAQPVRFFFFFLRNKARDLEVTLL